MRSLMQFALIFMLCSQAAPAYAEMFFTRPNVDIVYAGDHVQDDFGFATKREIRAHGGGFADPSRIQVYTGWRDGYGGPNLTELYVCDEATNEIHRFSIDADGAARTGSFFRYSDNHPCTEFLAYRGSIYLNGSGAEINVYDNTAAAPQAPTATLVEPFANNFSSIRGDGDYVYALSDAFEVIRWRIGDGQVVGDLVATTLLGSADRYCPRPWNAIEVLDGWVFVASGDDPLRNQICVFDARDPGVNITSLAPLRRKISSSDLLGIPTQLAASGDELYVVTGDGVMVYDFMTGGALPPKRRMAIPDVDYIWVTEAAEPEAPSFELVLEEPVNGAVHSGVGNVRGWAIASEGITKVDIYIDGELFQSAPYGGNRADVGAAFPDIDGSSSSGFSLAYNYGALDVGEHTLVARAQTRTGQILESSSTFNSIRAGQEFIAGADAVDLSGASCSINQGRSIKVEDIIIDGGGPWDAFLEWQPAAQAFEVQTYIFNADAI
jgi:hypothetical protein